MRFKIPLHTRIVIGMLVGIVGGLIARTAVPDPQAIEEIIGYVKPVGDLFLRFIFMTIIPLIVSALILGVAEVGDLRELGRIGGKMLGYTFIVTGISVFIGITMVTVFQPGAGMAPDSRNALIELFTEEVDAVAGRLDLAPTQRPVDTAHTGAIVANGAAPDTLVQNVEVVRSRSILDILVSIVPRNPLEDMVRAFDPTYTGGGLLSVMFFALIFGIALSASDKSKTAGIKAALESLYELTMKVIGYAMKLAPLGVAALLFVVTVNLGFDLLRVLAQYVLVVLAALAIQQFVVYSIILKYFANQRPWPFFKGMGEVIVTAFSTSSSNATLPTAIRVSIEKLKLPREVVHFVLTVGSTANQNGTALYEGITILFLAQVFGIDLDFADKLLVIVMCVLAGIGTAGVPGGSLPVIMLILIKIGVPGGAIALIFGVDRILDMSRTVLNVTGDITAAAYIAHSERDHFASAIRPDDDDMESEPEEMKED